MGQSLIRVMWLLCRSSVLIFFCVSVLMADAQESPFNLVTNGGFEIHDGCTNDLGETDKCLDWWPLYGSPDYFHRCGTSGYVPAENLLGTQEPYIVTDSAYVGIGTFATIFPGGQESLMTQLIQPLVAGKEYRVKFKVSLADNVNYASCCVGAIFDITAPPSPPYSVNINDVELVLSSNSVDSELWYELDEVYTAVGGEDKMYIGNFKPDNESEPYFIGEVSDLDMAYFYIDDVEVYEDDLMGVGDVDAGKIEVSVYPNPNRGDMTIAIVDDEETALYKLVVVNLIGEIVFDTQLHSGRNDVDLVVAAGSYLYKVIRTDGTAIDKGNVVIMQK